MIKNLVVKGAREHNLKNIDVEIPRDSLVVFSGLSGSGKSSLAFDTIYAEGQRRYVESLSSYARQFLGQMEKPDVDYIEGLSPAISIDQKTTSKNPRSTVGTVTEIYDYLRLLYARIGIPHCPICGREITQQTIDQIVDSILSYPEKTKIQIMAPIVRGRKGEYVKELDDARRSGFVRVRVDGSIYDLSEEIKMEKNKKHNIEVVVDRLVVSESIRSRLTDSIETATRLSKGLVLCDVIDGFEELFSLDYACPEHGVSIEEMSPRMFSFNNPYGACKRCSGLGTFMEIDEDLIIPNRKLSVNQGAIKASGWNVADGSSIARMYFEALAAEYNFSLDMPVEMLSKEAIDVILHGTKGKKIKMKRVTSYGSGTYVNDFEGVVNNLKRRYEETSSEYSRAEIETVMVSSICPDCKGARLSPISLAVTVGGKNIYEFCQMSISEEISFIDNLEFFIFKTVGRNHRLQAVNPLGLPFKEQTWYTEGEVIKMAEYRKGSHTVYDIKYHFVWITKYRYQVLKGDVALRLRELLRQGCEANHIRILKGSVGTDHVHMLLSCPTTLSPSQIMQYLKGRSSRILQDEYPTLKKRYWGQHMWGRGYFCGTVGEVDQKTIEEYIKNQGREEPTDNFTIVP